MQERRNSIKWYLFHVAAKVIFYRIGTKIVPAGSGSSLTNYVNNLFIRLLIWSGFTEQKKKKHLVFTITRGLYPTIDGTLRDMQAVVRGLILAVHTPW